MVKSKKLLALAVSAVLTVGAAMAGAPGTARAVAPSGNVTLIDNDAQWKYHDQDVDLYAQQFYLPAYDDGAWAAGQQPLGYPASDAHPLFGALSTGKILNNRGAGDAILTYYFRKDVQIETLEDLTALNATVGVDDGFVLYINGAEAYRGNMDAGAVTHASDAVNVVDPDEAGANYNLNLSSKIGLLTAGTNKIAVSVHNRDKNSSDIYFAMNLTALYSETPVPDDGLVPRQVNAHIGDDPATQMNLTYTTLAPADTAVTYKAEGSADVLTAAGESSQGAADKYFHGIALTDLTPDTRYEYTVGSGLSSFTGHFKTAPAKGSKDSFKFAYLADTQVSNAENAKALGATLFEVAKGGYDFVYLAGDHTDTATSEAQWEWLFYNDGQFPAGGQEMYGNNTVAVIQGNHDNSTLQRHINAPAQAGNIVYSYDYGPATFIMINLETARVDATARARQADFVRERAREAKARGQWTIVGFHKSLYTGASHITDSDVIDARKFWAPIFIEEDIDLVLQGHDHVYSRGFVDAQGFNANPARDAGGKVSDPKNAAMWMVGGHAGGLKWYSKKNYTVGSGDPLAPGYSFLDKNSTDDGSDIKKEQVIVEIEMSNAEFTVKTYMFKYDTASDTITTPKYLYDTVTVKRDARGLVTARTTGSSAVAVESADKTVSYNVSLSGLDAGSTNAVRFDLSYDPAVMELKSVQSLLEGTVFQSVKAENGVVSVLLGTSVKIPLSAANIAKVHFELKEDAAPGDYGFSLVGAETGSAYEENGIPTAFRDLVRIDPARNTVVTTVYTYEAASDVNGDGIVSILDLSIALMYFQTGSAYGDSNRDGVVDTADYIIIAGYFAA